MDFSLIKPHTSSLPSLIILLNIRNQTLCYKLDSFSISIIFPNQTSFFITIAYLRLFKYNI